MDSYETEIITSSNNGKLIGILEGFIISIGILIQNIVIIGLVLGIRSYVSVSSHKNKEESEYYIIGLLGSLIITIVYTSLYIILVQYATKINLLDHISNNLPSFKIMEVYK